MASGLLRLRGLNARAELASGLHGLRRVVELFKTELMGFWALRPYGLNCLS